MDNRINNKLSKEDGLASIVSAKNFVALDKNIQKKIIDAVHEDKSKESGIMGKFLGTRATNVAMHIGFIICIFLLITWAIDLVHSYLIRENINLELTQLILPVVTLYLGYIFGKGGV